MARDIIVLDFRSSHENSTGEEVIEMLIEWDCVSDENGEPKPPSNI
jgi:hypothetical protein